MGRPACLVRIHPERCRIGDKKTSKTGSVPGTPWFAGFYLRRWSGKLHQAAKAAMDL
jgi:hypothetical protein